MTGSIIQAFTDEQVARLTGISVGQLRYWDRTSFFRPDYASENRSDPFSRIDSYLDLVSLKVIARLRSRVPLQRRQAEVDRHQPGPMAWHYALGSWSRGRL